MTSNGFDQLWEDMRKRGEFQQSYEELNHIYNLMEGAKTYLEVGCAEGSSFYILGQQVKEKASYIDWAEEHTLDKRNEVINKLQDRIIVEHIHGDTTEMTTYSIVKNRKFDCVLIDAGHDFSSVLSDSILYAPLATKYVFWHDMQLPEVKKAVEWFVKRWPFGEFSTFINSDHFGYGILRIIK